MLFSFLCFSSKSFAQADSYYISIDTSYAGVTSSEDYTNGAQDSVPSFTVGYRFTEYNLELSYGKFTYTNTHEEEEDTGTVTITDSIEDTSISFGIRGSHNQYFESKFGFSLNNIVGTFVDDQGAEYVSPVDGFFFGLYFGTGPKIKFSENFDMFFDMTLRRISKDIFTVGYNFGLRYFF